MKATASSTTLSERIDAVLDQLQSGREYAMARLVGPERAVRMATLYELEARCWASLFECTRTRVYWRAALAAEVGAHRLARHWRRRAEMEAQGVVMSAGLDGCVEIRDWVDRWQAELAGGAS